MMITVRHGGEKTSLRRGEPTACIVGKAQGGKSQQI
jgi:hypothetical protein